MVELKILPIFFNGPEATIGLKFVSLGIEFFYLLRTINYGVLSDSRFRGFWMLQFMIEVILFQN